MAEHLFQNSIPAFYFSLSCELVLKSLLEGENRCMPIFFLNICKVGDDRSSFKDATFETTT